MGLGDVVAVASGDGSLKKIIKLRLVRREVVPFLDEKSFLRVSAFADMCPREEVLCATKSVRRARVVEAELGLIFAHGTALHWALQNLVLADAGVLIGVWRCLTCARDHGAKSCGADLGTSLARRPDKCSGCGGVEFIYREQHYTNDQFRIGGHPDGFLIVPGLPGVGLVECKSISTRGAWEIRNVPNMGHVIQSQLYMWLTDTQWTKILYWEKGAYGLGCLTEHTVERDEETIDKAKQIIMSVWNGIAAGILPSRICETAGCPRAKKCDLVKPCFEEL